MPLTPEDVRNKQFSTVKFKEGYNEDEVDEFLDQVEAELNRLLKLPANETAIYLACIGRPRRGS